MSIDSINSVNSASASSSSSSTSKLSEETKKKLQALGLDPTKYTSEAQAQTAITEAQNKQASNKPAAPSNFQTIKNEVQDLASKMGIIPGANDKINDIMANISDKITELQATAGTDSAKLAQVSDYNSQYTTISNELAQMEAAKNMTGASAMANYNKAALGLAA